MFEKLIAIYPQLTKEDFHPIDGTIFLQNDMDERGTFIAKWEHPTLARPTEEQLA
jgi:hypothetical protein